MRLENNPQQNEAKREPLSTYLVIISCLCILVQFYALPHGRATLTSIANRTLLVLWILVAGYQALRKYLLNVPRQLSSLLLVLVLSLFSFLMAILDGGSQAEANFFKTMGFWVLPMMILYFSAYPITPVGRKAVLLTGVGASLIFIYLYHSDMRHLMVGDYGDYYMEEVTLGFANPNQTAVYLFVCALLLAANVFEAKKKFWKLLVSVDCAYILWILYGTKSRTAIVAIIVFAVLLYSSFRKGIRKSWIGITLAVPLIYALLSQVAFTLLGDITILDDPLFNGRENIFGEYFTQLNVLNFFFGNFNEFQFDNMHNGYISVAATVGILVLISYIPGLRNALEYNLRPEMSRGEKAGFLSFLCIILYTSTEAAFFVGGSTFAFVAMMPYLLFAQPYVSQNERETEESP